MTEIIEFTNAYGQRLVGELDWVPDQPLVICAHGLQSSRGATKLRALCDSLRVAEISSLRFDFAGRGDSEGEFFDVTYSRQIDDLKSAIDYCEERLGLRKFGFMGSSMGGAVSLLVAGRDPRIQAVCTVAAIGYPSELEERYPLKTRGWRERGFVELDGEERLGKAFLEDAGSHDVMRVVSWIDAPMLVVHGTDDAVIPIADADDIAASSQNVEMLLVEGADHRFSEPRHLESLVHEAVEFFANHLT